MARNIKKAKTWAYVGMMGAALATIAAPAFAQQQQAINSIEVLVNDEPISSYDINQRLRLVIAVSGGVSSEQEFLKVREQVIRSMVDERLQLQEAKEVDLNIEADRLEQFFDRRAQSVGQTADMFEKALRQIGSSKQTMLEQMEAELAWSQLVQGRFGSFASVSDEEVEAYIQRIYDNRGKFEYHLAEIVLLVDSADQEASVKANANELVNRLRGGASFPDVAQQLSASSTAAVGGDLGWLTGDDITGAYAQAVKDVTVGQVSEPIRTPGGYIIIAVRDRRRVLTADPLDTQFSLRQLFLPKDQTEDATKAAQFESQVAGLHNAEVSCADTGSIAEKAGADSRQEIGVLRLRDLQGEIRSAVEPMQAGQATPMMKMEDGWRVLVVCGRQEPQVQEPDFQAIYDQIEQQRLSMIARRYLRDIRRDAIVDYR